MSEKWIGWHFLPADRMTRFEPRVKVRKGSVLRENRPLVMCEIGLHASLRAIDALMYAPGPVVCRVELRGERLDASDKSCASERKVTAISDATAVLHEFACCCAGNALQHERKAGHEPDQRSWDAIRVKRRWLHGDATDEELSAASAAASAAARSAARSAAWSAARSAVWSAARSAVWSAASAAAWEADWAAASAAAWEADWAAASRLWEARAAQNRKLESMLRKLLGCE